MITRPLELSTRLRPPPKSFDFVFLVNGALIALFFVIFGSRFVLSPGLKINGQNLHLGASPTAVAGATPTGAVLSVNASGQIFVEDGGIIRTEAELKKWLAAQAKKSPGAALLVRADEVNQQKQLLEISNLAAEVGLGPVIVALQTGGGAAPTGSGGP